MMLSYVIVGLVALLIVCGTILLHQHNASKREEKRIALLDKGIDMVGAYLNRTVASPYPADLLPQNSVYANDVLPLLDKPNGSESKSGSGSSNESGRGAFDGSGSEKQKKLNTVYQFYTRYPDASLADGVRSLGIPDATLSRLHDALVTNGNILPFPKNR